MKSRYRHLGAAAVVLVISLSVAPMVSAAGYRDGDSEDVGAKIARVVKKIKKIFVSIGTLEDYPYPPKP
jgi:hypothetical protein